MQNNAATLHCPNELCQAANSQTDKFCQRCGTPLIKRYLWAVGEGIEGYKPGDLWLDRYWLTSQRIFLDTKPGLSPETLYSTISDRIKHYLRLVPYRLQVPQVYALVPGSDGRATDILLLEQAPIYPDALPLEGQLMPELTDAWKDATPMRQLNWLWQIAQLWQPLKSEGVASSLLKPKLLRVEESLVRLLELQLDQSVPTLAELGQLWLKMLSGAQPPIAVFLEQLCHSLIQGGVPSSEELIARLDQGLAEVGRSLSRILRIATCTDTGPNRQRNEDACYPPSGTTITPPSAVALAIVCDGIGGHEGGNVASNLAIESIQQQLQQLSLNDANLDPTTVSSELESAACYANDQISQRNDNEHRHGRQRMGTTLVMALAHAHEIYIAHVGDSRAYWITRTGCHQVTLDDDVASREVRLGYALYRDALQHSSSGSLVQALGMSPSVSLHPTVQRFVLDEDCVFLLCSDGLSDYDRVEQCWDTEILPILDGKVDVATAGLRLVEIANTQNGHDNVTVGLVYCQVNSSEQKSMLSAPLAQQTTVESNFSLAAELNATVAVAPLSPATPSSLIANPPEPANAVGQPAISINFPESTATTLQTKLLPSQPAQRRFFGSVLVGIILVLSLGGVAYWFKDQLGGLVKPWISFNSSTTPLPAKSSPAVSPAPNLTADPCLKKDSLIKIKKAISLETEKPQKHKAIAPNLKSSLHVLGVVPAGSSLKVVNKPQEGDWLQLRICSLGGFTGKLSVGSPSLLVVGKEGWIGEKTLKAAELKTPDSSQGAHQQHQN